ncbi:MAG: hypothetical protein KA116_06075 [Proteobacteria bacterium]|nr:hypothetical protein [Pseudomonadota bacterium]
MNKIFWFLVVMCFVAAGVLWWLLRMSPPSDTKHFSENKIEVIEKDKHEDHSVEADTEHAADTVHEAVAEHEAEAPKHDEAPNHKEEAPKHEKSEVVEKTKSDEKPEAKVAKEGPEAPPEIAVDMIVGKKGPVFLQLGSVPLEEWLRGNLDLNAYQGAVACKVEIPGKGANVRILMGPYANKKMALKAKAEKTSIPSDSFVTGEQKCLK